MTSSTRPASNSDRGQLATDEATLGQLPVEGALPASLSGRYLLIAPTAEAPGRPSEGGAGTATVHSVALLGGCAVGYLSRRVVNDATARASGAEPVAGARALEYDDPATAVVRVGGATLAVGDGALALVLDEELRTVRRVDLAGGRRGICGRPRIDPLTGDVHLLSAHGEHVTLSANGLTRTVRPVVTAVRSGDLVATRDHVVVLGDGRLTVARRAGEPRPHTHELAPGHHVLVNAWDDSGDVVAVVGGDSLRQVRLPAGRGPIQVAVVDGNPHRFARIDERRLGRTCRFVWTTDGRTARRVDLLTGASLRVGPGFDAAEAPGGWWLGEMLFVADPSGTEAEGDGWLLGFAHHHHHHQQHTHLLVLDATAPGRPAVARVHITRSVHDGGHGTWLPAS